MSIKKWEESQGGYSEGIRKAMGMGGNERMMHLKIQVKDIFPRREESTLYSLIKIRQWVRVKQGWE